ncbi:MAG TPA: sigma-54-dependent Fis family transcriptional regulator, partial [Sporomusaceae bacterium]|nr:sigma-54-dependent Fis family transcriptional regulator [Sporomusaceae bacterium]
MLYVKKLARRASRTSSTLLITGESGTGKEIIAQAIHTRSVRREAPFITVN